ncbi:hypothetical protein BDZ97DRAFT_446445 [Flammula alnicola]|nr:hypothetical protein BDZ97DRAFT_446445 [Flammula alnicola]
MPTPPLKSPPGSGVNYPSLPRHLNLTSPLSNLPFLPSSSTSPLNSPPSVFSRKKGNETKMSASGTLYFSSSRTKRNRDTRPTLLQRWACNKTPLAIFPPFPLLLGSSSSNRSTQLLLHHSRCQVHLLSLLPSAMKRTGRTKLLSLFPSYATPDSTPLSLRPGPRLHNPPFPWLPFPFLA